MIQALNNMIIYNNIIKKRLFKFLPKFITDFLLDRIIYFEKVKKKTLPKENYTISKSFEQDYVNQVNLKEEEIKKLNFIYPNLQFIINLLFKKKKFNFLDYGAGDLKNYLILKSSYNNLKYYYKDQSIFENFFRKKKVDKKFDNFNFLSEKKNEYFDFIYFGSSFQYIENIDDILLKIISKKTKYLLISGVTIFQHLKENLFICKQCNMPKQNNYLYFYNKKYLVKKLEKFGFKLAFTSKNLSDPLINYKNFKNNNFLYCDLFFQKC